MAAPITLTLEADGLLLATMDMAGRTMNVFSVELMDAIDALMDRVEGDAAVKSCVITSGKPTFLAGADLLMVQGYCDAAKTATHDAMFVMCGRLGRQFVRMEASPKPYVAAVNGLALGGGLELALACRERYVANDAKLQLGVPEVRWGLLPGAGGTQRLPRMVGFDAAMQMLLTGRSVDPATGLKLGFVSGVVPASELLEKAKAAARAMVGKPYDPAQKFKRLAQTDVPAHSAATALAVAEKVGVSAPDFAQYPAYSAIVDSVLHGAHQSLAVATTTEMNQFLRLMFSPVAGRMVRTLFLERLRAERELAAPAGAAVASVRTGALSSQWQAALAKLKLPCTPDSSLPAGTLVVTDSNGAAFQAVLRDVNDAPAPANSPQLVLGPQGPYGRVMEVVGVGGPSAAASTAVFAALAAKLWSLAWPTPGPTSRLAQLAGQPLQEQARRASAWTDGDPAFTDVAACLAGLAPAWSGGPLTWLADPR